MCFQMAQHLVLIWAVIIFLTKEEVSVKQWDKV